MTRRAVCSRDMWTSLEMSRSKLRQHSACWAIGSIAVNTPSTC